jgi:nicotinamide N-methyltransferase
MSLLPPRRTSGVQAPAVAASPTVLSVSEKMLKSRHTEFSFRPSNSLKTSIKSTSSTPIASNTAQSNTVVNISNTNNHFINKLSNIPPSLSPSPLDPALADELDYITVSAPVDSPSQPRSPRPLDKASRILGIAHRKSMEPIPASTRTSIVSTRSAPSAPTQHAPTLPLTSLYVVSGLPKSPHTWTLADPDAVLGLSHSEGAVARWWRPEVLGSTVSPGAGGGKKKKKTNKGETEILKGAGALTKPEVGKMLSKALKAGSYLVILTPANSSCRIALIHA